MMARACRQVRRQLSAFCDGELPVGDQIAFQAHLRECPACAAEVREMEELGACLRTGALATAVDPEEWQGLPSMVVSRMKAEDAQSFIGLTGRFFEDMHLVWAVLGATGATVTCLALIFTIFYYAISSPAGSNMNPMVMNARMSLPSATSNDAFPAAAVPDQEDLALALDAVVTREGRIAKLEVIQPGGGPKGLSREERQAVLALLDVISKARFEPARYAGSGAPVPVAVNMVWLYASLTVKAKMPELRVQPKPSRSSTALPAHTLATRVRLA
jgi:anti-sigma factor RsiW